MAICCFINPDYRLIRTTSPPILIRIIEGFLCMDRTELGYEDSRRKEVFQARA
jgi:hypothetical protein